MQKILILVCLAAAMPSAYGVLLIPNTEVNLPGTTVLNEPWLEGVVLQDRVLAYSMTVPNSGDITGWIQERVVKEKSTGTLDFYWRVMNDTTSGGNLEYFRLGHFVDNSYDANWRIDGEGTVIPKKALLFGGVYSGKGYINFYMPTGLKPGESSAFMFLHTDATAYAETAFLDVATAGTYHAGAMRPTFAPVPEPATYLAGLAALGMLGLFGWRNSQ